MFKILHRYIGRSVLITFIATLLVMIGILCLGNLLQIADLIVKGMDPALIGKFLFFLIISLLQESIPMAMLTATLLVFGRLSSDNEITAMRACGVGLRTVTAPVLFLGAALTLVSIHLNNTAIPNYNLATRKLKAQIGLKDPELLLEPGEFIKLPGYSISVESKKSGYLRNVWIYQYEEGKLASAIFAQRAKIETGPGREGFGLHLYDGSIDEYDRDNPQISTRTVFGYLKQPIDLTALFEEEKEIDRDKRTKDMTQEELLRYRSQMVDQYGEAINHLKGLLGQRGAALGDSPSLRQLERLRAVDLGSDAAPQKDILLKRLEGLRAMISQVTTEMHKRLSLSAACLAFVLIAIPLGIKAHRSEKSIGMAISLILIFIFYIFILYAKAVADLPERYPHLIIWIPNALYVVAGTCWIVRFSRI
jgi:lipopolysaccharide export system permease protein